MPTWISHHLPPAADERVNLSPFLPATPYERPRVMRKLLNIAALTALLKQLAESPTLMVFLMGLAGLAALVYVVQVLHK